VITVLYSTSYTCFKTAASHNDFFGTGFGHCPIQRIGLETNLFCPRTWNKHVGTTKTDCEQKVHTCKLGASLCEPPERHCRHDLFFVLFPATFLLLLPFLVIPPPPPSSLLPFSPPPPSPPLSLLLLPSSSLILPPAVPPPLSSCSSAMIVENQGWLRTGCQRSENPA
jgi:hypothetical protein